MAKVFAILTLLSLSANLYAADLSCSNPEARPLNEGLDCSSILAEFTDFVYETEGLLRTDVDQAAPDYTELSDMLKTFSAHAESLRGCLAKHGSADSSLPLRDIYTTATIAEMDLRAWINHRPRDPRMRSYAISKLDGLVEMLRENEHNNAFSTDSTNRCGG
jgi:hypothetical protein